MRKLLEKLICKYIIKILKIYQKNIENDNLNFKNYLDQTMYFEIQYLIRLLKEKEE